MNNIVASMYLRNNNSYYIIEFISSIPSSSLLIKRYSRYNIEIYTHNDDLYRIFIRDDGKFVFSRVGMY